MKYLFGAVVGIALTIGSTAFAASVFNTQKEPSFQPVSIAGGTLYAWYKEGSTQHCFVFVDKKSSSLSCN